VFKMGLTYRDAGVDIQAGEEAVSRIKNIVKTTFNQEVMSGLGGFAGLFAPDFSKYKEPVLVSGTDGVGTKLKLAFMSDKHDTVGIDLVAMSVNDILVQGARPLFFLDYLATGKLMPAKADEIVNGIAEACRQAGAALIGGETAEMPDFYEEGEYDLAGFTVGIVDKSKLITGENINPGDRIIGLKANGLHSNGFSLARKVFFELNNYNIDTRLDSLELTLGEELLKPTRIYVKPVLRLIEEFEINGLAHITGGGFPGNIPRIIPKDLGVIIEKNKWPLPSIYKEMQSLGGIDEKEMYRTFNMGIGMVLIVKNDIVDDVINMANKLGEKAYLIGRIIDKNNFIIE